MPVDTTTPVPDELDARVEQMLAHMDRVHAEVVNRLGEATDESTQASSPASDESPPAPPPAAEPAGLDAEVEKALSRAADAARTTAAEPGSNGADVPTATIKELDERLADTVSTEPVDDDFADGSSLVEGQSLDVPLPPGSAAEALKAAVGEPPAAAVPAVPQPAPVAAPAAPAPVTAPAPAPAVKPAPAPASKPAPAPVKPAVVAAPAKPAGPTVADRFWRIATPVMEPIAVRLGKLPVSFQHTVGWIGIVTLFMAGATWAYVVFFQETRVASHIMEQEKADAAEDGGHGKPEANKAGAGHDDNRSAAPASHDEKKPASHEAPKPADAKGAHDAGHKPEAPAPSGH
ncbi:MAG TPA: hypothetical protein VEB22_06115 [Phycisphaerales bacterium]|nr:hypothetical protein [Phycisphaerales bacterium]